MKRIAYFDCFSGVAGDMGLGALLDAGLALNDLEKGLKSMQPLAQEWKFNVSKVCKGKGSIAATFVKVVSAHGNQDKLDYSLLPEKLQNGYQNGSVDASLAQNISFRVKNRLENHGNESQENGRKFRHKHSHGHSHSHQNLHGHSHQHSHGHSHQHSHRHLNVDHVSNHVSDHHHEEQAHVHRNLPIIRDLIMNASELPPIVQEKALKAFTLLAEAEASVHGVHINDIHFHEVGAVDSIIDTVGVVLGLHLMGVDLETGVFCSPLPFNSGYVKTAHGILPCPAPATLHLLKGFVCIPAPGGVRGELVTPTGVALLKALCAPGRCGVPPPPFIPQLSGIGCGRKDFEDHPNILRVIIGNRYDCSVAARSVWDSVKASGGIHTGHSSLQTRMTAQPLHVARPITSNHSNQSLLNQTKFQATETDMWAQIKAKKSWSHRSTPVKQTLTKLKTDDTTELVRTNHSSNENQNNSILEVQSKSHANELPKQTSTSKTPLRKEELVIIETNIDDLSPEVVSFAAQQLLSAGALDVWTTPIQMKKGRTGVKLSALCTPGRTMNLQMVLFSETSTLGVRISKVERVALHREFVNLSNVFPKEENLSKFNRPGVIKSKHSFLPSGKIASVKPEFEDCANIARQTGLPLKAVQQAAVTAAAAMHFSHQ